MRDVNVSAVFWILGSVSLLVFIVSLVVGERVDGLGLAGFLLLCLAIWTDRSLGERVKPPPRA